MIYHRTLNIVPCVICITESLVCIAVINATLQINYTSIENKKK